MLKRLCEILFVCGALFISHQSFAATDVAKSAVEMRSSIELIEVQNFMQSGQPRTLRVYLPPSYKKQVGKYYPLLLMHDGQNLFDAKTSYAGEWEVDESLDRLAGKGIEWIVVGIDHANERRMLELSPWTNEKFGQAQGEAYAQAVVEQVLPLIHQRYRVKKDRENTFVMGSSMGGLMSHYLLLRYPQVFSGAGVLSPSYWYADEIWSYTTTNTLPEQTLLYLSMGEREGRQPLRDARRMRDALQTRYESNRLIYREVPKAKHNEAQWREEVVRVMEWLSNSSNQKTSAK